MKVSVLAEMSGVPAATIKHYVREGLLPEPTRTSRNMAYYDPALVERIQRIKEMQRTRFLPLKVIKQVLDESELENQDETVAATIARVIEQTSTERDERTRAQLLASGVVESQLEMLRRLGVVRPLEGRDEETYVGDDVELLRVLGAARKAGLAEAMLPVEILGDYARALSRLVEIELRLFREGVVPNATPEQLPALTEAATMLSERLVVLMRRKMLVPTMRQLSESSRRESAEPEAKKRGERKDETSVPARARPRRVRRT
ncbi:MAG: MerR family transcriptional regulator [Sandaracinaceae bacterium]|nr:MerR family transcriptional regulator [Sandaracinaceae bacterium]